jgi:hypothetical protein
MRGMSVWDIPQPNSAVGKHESKTRSEKETIPLAWRFHSPLHDGDLPHTVGSPSPSVPFPIAAAIPMKAVRYRWWIRVGEGYDGRIARFVAQWRIRETLGRPRASCVTRGPGERPRPRGEEDKHM